MNQNGATSVSLSIVIPAYNEEQRLPGTLKSLHVFLRTQWQGRGSVEVIVVDDGSTDGTSQVIRDLQSTFREIQEARLSFNQGKGAAVHHGLHRSSGEWILIADADMSTPWSELGPMYAHKDDFSLVMGSRGLLQSRIVVRQHWLRQSMGKTFNKILRSMVGLPYRDTQCGFKLLRNDRFFRETVLPSLSVRRFAWDVELILFLHEAGKKILEWPVEWSHQEHSRVRLLKDSVEMLWTVMKLRFRNRKIDRDASLNMM